jgi:MHS family proline/betaine transporter-like MFS transporter
MLRRSLHETIEFETELRRRRQVAAARSPLRLAFGSHGAALAVGFGLSILWAVAVYVLNIYTPVYVQRAFGFSAQQAFAASLIGNVLFVIGCLAAGRLSDRVGRRKVLAGGAWALLLGVLPLYHWLQAAPTTAVLIAVQSAFCLMVASFVGVAPAALSDLFPTAIRATGISLVYNAAFVVFGGLALPILTWFTRQAHGSAMAPAGYVICAAVIGLLTLPFFERQRAAVAATTPRGAAAGASA